MMHSSMSVSDSYNTSYYVNALHLHLTLDGRLLMFVANNNISIRSIVNYSLYKCKGIFITIFRKEIAY